MLVAASGTPETGVVEPIRLVLLEALVVSVRVATASVWGSGEGRRRAH